jgi:hypothetical protein
MKPAFLAALALAAVLVARWWREALTDARLMLLDDEPEDPFVPMAAWVPPGLAAHRFSLTGYEAARLFQSFRRD